MKKRPASTALMQLSAYAATCVIMLLSLLAVIAVQAFLEAQTDLLQNEFSALQITYTNIGVEEPTQEFTFSSSLTSVSPNVSTKSATIQNPAGTDRKPVFVRAAVTLAVQDTNGIDVTTDYPSVLQTLTLGGNWEKNDADGFYYYKKILIPGIGDDSKTTDLFGGAGVTFTQPVILPDGYKVIVNVIGDAIQAVDTDEVDWTAADYFANGSSGDSSVKAMVQSAWGRIPAVSADGLTLTAQAATSVTWS